MNFTRNEKIILALIPVIGSIIVALIGAFKSSADVDPPPPKPVVEINHLKRAGEINNMVVFDNYNELLPNLSDIIKPIITRVLFKQVNDSVKVTVGDFLRPTDTTEVKIGGEVLYTVKNQHERGQSLTTISFDNHGHVTKLFYMPIQNY